MVPTDRTLIFEGTKLAPMSESRVLMVGEEVIDVVIVLMEQGGVMKDAGARVVEAEGRCIGHHRRRSGNTVDVGE